MSSLNFKKKIEKIQELEEEDMAASLIPRGEEIKQKQLQQQLQIASQSLSGNKIQGTIFDSEPNEDDVDDDVGHEQQEESANNEMLLNNKLTRYSIQAQQQWQSNDGNKNYKNESSSNANGNNNMPGLIVNPFVQSNQSYSISDNLNAGEDGNSHSESASSGSQTEQTALLQFKQAQNSSNDKQIQNLSQQTNLGSKPFQLKSSSQPTNQLGSTKGMNLQLGISSQGGSSFGRRTFQRPSQVEEKLVDDVIDEDEEEDQVFDKDNTQNSSSFQQIKGSSKQGVSSISGRERKKFNLSQEKMEKYEEIKQESKITAYALSNQPRSQQITSKNYKSLICSHMKENERSEIGKSTRNNDVSKAKMISTEVESQIKLHIVNHKVRANQKYQVVKNFFKIWFINTKEIRRQEKKVLQKNITQIIANKLNEQTEEANKQIKKKKFLNEKHTGESQVAEKSQKGMELLAGQQYVKPGNDIKLFIPFCADIYLGRD